MPAFSRGSSNRHTVGQLPPLHLGSGALWHNDPGSLPGAAGQRQLLWLVDSSGCMSVPGEAETLPSFQTGSLAGRQTVSPCPRCQHCEGFCQGFQFPIVAQRACLKSRWVKGTVLIPLASRHGTQSTNSLFLYYRMACPHPCIYAISQYLLMENCMSSTVLNPENPECTKQAKRNTAFFSAYRKKMGDRH